MHPHFMYYTSALYLWCHFPWFHLPPDIFGVEANDPFSDELSEGTSLTLHHDAYDIHLTSLSHVGTLSFQVTIRKRASTGQ